MNMQQIMQQARKMQQDIEKKKNELDKMEFTGKSEWVEVIFNGKKELKSLKILKSDGINSDDTEILEDMISIAMTDAFKKIDVESQNMLGQYANMSGLF